MPEKESIRSLAAHKATMILFLSMSIIDKLQAELTEGGISADTPAVIVYKATWPDERIYHCTVGTLAATAKEHDVKRTALVIVGEFLGKEYGRSKLYSPDFSTEYRSAKA